MTHVVEGRGFFAKASVDDFPSLSKIIHIEANMPLDEAFDVLVSNKIHCAPVYDESAGAYVGFLDVADVVAHVVASLHRTSEPDADAPDVFLNLRELLLWANHDSPDTARDVVNLSERNPFRSVPTGASLLDVLELLGNKNLKRVPVVDLVSGKIVNLITQSSLSSFLHSQPLALDALAGTTVGKARLGYCDVVTISQSAAALRAFEVINKHEISAIGITEKDHNSRLVAVVSDTDMRAMVTLENFQIYGMKVMALLKRLRPGHAEDVVAVQPDTPLADLPAIFQTKKVHRVFITDPDSGHAIGVITFKDMLAYLLSKVKKEYVDWTGST